MPKERQRVFHIFDLFLAAKHLQKPAMKISELTQLSQLSLNSPAPPPQHPMQGKLHYTAIKCTIRKKYFYVNIFNEFIFNWRKIVMCPGQVL